MSRSIPCERAGVHLANRRPAVLVIGAGLYVCGRGTSTYGTVLPTLVQAQTQELIGDILVAATARDSIKILQDKLTKLNAHMGTHVQVRGYPVDSQRDPLAYRQILKELPRPACAVVVVPDQLHTSITADVIRAGLHCLVVKPLTPTLRETHELIGLAETCNVYGAVEFHKRFDEANLLLQQSITEGRLGDLCYIVVEYSQRRSIRKIFHSWIQHTSVFQYLGVHYVDLIYFVTGARPVRVLATGQPSSLVTEDLSSLDAIQALVEWKDQRSEKSFVSTIVTSWIDPDSSSAMSDQRIMVVGTLGRFQSDQKNRGVQVVTDQGVEDVNPYFTQTYADATGDFTVRGYGPRSIQQFLTDVRDLTERRRDLRELVSNRPSFQDALVSTAVIEAVNCSLSQGGRWVAIDQEALASVRKIGER